MLFVVVKFVTASSVCKATCIFHCFGSAQIGQKTFLNSQSLQTAILLLSHKPHATIHFRREANMTFACRCFLFRMLLYFLLETLSHAVGNPTHQVKGILGGSVLFSANVSQGITVEKMEWDFLPQRGGLGFWLAEFSHGKLEHQSPTNQFEQRLDMVDKTTLKLKDLELGDSGIYNARIWITKTQFQEQRFNLTVYEPVPTPQIHHQVESKTPGGCNVTLRCHTPGREELKISWETRDPHRALGKSMNQYQVSDNGQELRVSFWNSSLDSKFTCLVSNPVDRKRASFDLLKICQSDEVILVAMVLAVVMMLVLVLVLVMKISKRHRRGVGSLMEKKGESTLTLQNSKMIDDDDDLVDSGREELTTSSTPPRECCPSPNSSPLSDTEPSEIECCIPQTNMGVQAQHKTSVRSPGAIAEEFTEGPSVERPTEDVSSLPVEPELQPTQQP